jgi:hypothetical protein
MEFQKGGTPSGYWDAAAEEPIHNAHIAHNIVVARYAAAEIIRTFRKRSPSYN